MTIYPGDNMRLNKGEYSERQQYLLLGNIREKGDDALALEERLLDLSPRLSRVHALHEEIDRRRLAGNRDGSYRWTSQRWTRRTRIAEDKGTRGCGRSGGNRVLRPQTSTHGRIDNAALLLSKQ